MTSIIVFLLPKIIVYRQIIENLMEEALPTSKTKIRRIVKDVLYNSFARLMMNYDVYNITQMYEVILL